MVECSCCGVARGADDLPGQLSSLIGEPLRRVGDRFRRVTDRVDGLLQQVALLRCLLLGLSDRAGGAVADAGQLAAGLGEQVLGLLTERLARIGEGDRTSRACP